MEVLLEDLFTVCLCLCLQQTCQRWETSSVSHITLTTKLQTLPTSQCVNNPLADFHLNWMWLQNHQNLLLSLLMVWGGGVKLALSWCDVNSFMLGVISYHRVWDRENSYTLNTITDKTPCLRNIDWSWVFVEQRPMRWMFRDIYYNILQYLK